MNKNNITKLLIVNTNGYDPISKQVKIVTVKTNGDPIEKYLERKSAFETDFIFELNDKQIKNLKKQLEKL